MSNGKRKKAKKEKNAKKNKITKFFGRLKDGTIF